LGLSTPICTRGKSQRQHAKENVGNTDSSATEAKDPWERRKRGKEPVGSFLVIATKEGRKKMRRKIVGWEIREGVKKRLDSVAERFSQKAMKRF